MDLKLPVLAESMTSAIVSAWLKQPGDRVVEGEPIVEVDIDKTIVEIDAPVSGRLLEISVPAGTEAVQVGTLLAVIEPQEIETGGPIVRTSQPVTAPTADRVSIRSTDDETSVAPTLQRPDIEASPLARKMAELAGLDLAEISGQGPGGRVRKTDVDRALRGEGMTRN